MIATAVFNDGKLAKRTGRSIGPAASLAALALVAGQAGAAQVGTGSLIRGRSSGMVQSIYGLPVGGLREVAVPNGAALTIARATAQCVVRSNAGLVKTYLDRSMGGEGRLKLTAVNGLEPTFSRCLGEHGNAMETRISLNSTMAMALIAEAFLSTEAVATPAIVPVASLYDVAMFQAQPSGVAKTSFCFARTEPVAAHAILRTQAGSTAERSALIGAMDGIRACTDYGASFKLDPIGFRLNLAQNFYSLVAQQAASASAGTN